jgi:hypothetical protein
VTHPALVDAASRLKRADERLTTLDHERSVFLDDVNDRILERLEPDTSEYVFYVEGQPPSEWFLDVSEFAMHLRSALDNTVCALIERRGNDTTLQSGFPVALTRTWWKSGNGRAARRGLSLTDAKIVKQFQPFVRRPQDPESDPLWLLNLFRNKDQHRRPHASYVRTQGFTDLPEVGQGIPGWPIAERDCVIAAFAIGNYANPGGPQTDVLRVGIHQTGPNPKVRVQGDLRLDVAFANGDRVFPYEYLAEMRTETGRVIEALTPQFA